MKRMVAILLTVGVLLLTSGSPVQAKSLFAFSPLFLPILLLYAAAPALAIALLGRLFMLYFFPAQGHFWLIFLLTLLGWFLAYLLPFPASSPWGAISGGLLGVSAGCYLSSLIKRKR
jgi:hypothetical protein